MEPISSAEALWHFPVMRNTAIFLSLSRCEPPSAPHPSWSGFFEEREVFLTKALISWHLPCLCPNCRSLRAEQSSYGENTGYARRSSFVSGDSGAISRAVWHCENQPSAQ